MDEKDTNQNLSTQKILQPGHEPGWNDPPNWVFTASQSSVTPNKRVLNKRVAFPLDSTSISDKQTNSNKPLNMPPPIQCSTNTSFSHPPLLNSVNKITDVKNNEMKIDKEYALNIVLTNFNSVINEHILEKSKAEEIKKRLGIMKIAWLEDKLNNMIHKNILDLSVALKDGNIEKADEIHVSLMMQHPNLCSAWIPGIRHIILGLKSKMQHSTAIHCEH